MDNTNKFIRAMEKITEGMEDLMSIDIEKEKLVQMFNEILPKHPLAVRLERVIEKLPDANTIYADVSASSLKPSNEFHEQYNKNAESLNKFLKTFHEIWN